MSKTVLVVDDEPGVCQLVMEILESNGYHGIEASEGLAAIRLLESGTVIDLLLVDLDLPNVHGRAVAQIARTLRPHLPVIVMTGHGEFHLQHDTMIERLGKPFSATELLARLESCL